MMSRCYACLFTALLLLLAVPPAQPVLWQTPPRKPTTGNPMPDPCERAPNLPFCK
jgi:hypothetical protein